MGHMMPHGIFAGACWRLPHSIDLPEQTIAPSARLSTTLGLELNLPPPPRRRKARDQCSFEHCLLALHHQQQVALTRGKSSRGHSGAGLDLRRRSIPENPKGMRSIDGVTEMRWISVPTKVTLRGEGRKQGSGDRGDMDNKPYRVASNEEMDL